MSDTISCDTAPKRKVAIIGAGPAGLMTAEVIARAGHDVTVYERMPSPARKLLMAGRGGLNLTHSEDITTFLNRYGPARDWLAPAINVFGPPALRDWADRLGQHTFVGSSGRVFPKAMKASPLLRAWLKRLDKAGVTLKRNHDWDGWSANGDLLFKKAAHERITVTRPDAVMLALGGASWPRLGANGAWAQILAAKGIGLAPFQPSNCGFTVNWSAILRDKFQGTPLKNVALQFDGQSVRGEAMITAQGIEGGAIYALSPALRDAIASQGHADLQLDLSPQLDLDTLRERLSTPRGKNSISNHLRKKANLSPLAIALMRESTSAPLPAAADDLAALIKACPLRLTGTTGLTRAISTAGGICRSAVDDNYMLKTLPGVFVAGEMLDWEAPTGGYLLQATISTAFASAHGLNAWLATDARRNS